MKIMSPSILFMLSSGKWGGLLWPSVPGGWPAAGTLQGGLLPPEGSVGAAGQDLARQQCLRGGGLWYCNRCVFVYICVCICLFSTATPFVIKPFHCCTCTPSMQSSIHWSYFSSSSVIHSLLDICSIISNLDIALHANTWKFLIKSVQQTLMLTPKFLLMPSVILDESLCYKSWMNLIVNFVTEWLVLNGNYSVQTESEISVVGGGTSTSRWHQQQSVWQPVGLLPQLCGAGRAN